MGAYADYPSLKGRHVFITGGATGIGAALVEAFAGQGALVGFIDIANEAGKALAERLGQAVVFQYCDVTRPQDLKAALDHSVGQNGPVTVLVNNVANDQRQPAAEMEADAWRANLAVNLDPVFLMSRAVQPGMVADGGGSIINLASINALLGPADLSAYTAAKAAVIGLSKSLAREWGGDRIRVNAVSPGWVVTDRQLQLWLTPGAEAAWMEQTALKQRITPQDVARLVLFLAADDSALITGQNLIIDGGRI
jgi:NAD(P)-dependent dehydrogenase (short-subunit alcohol dehydrogenase family)